MKKIELTAPLRFVLVILIWLLTFTVINLTGTLNNGGAGLIGTLVLYVGALYLAFVYFNDCKLKKACKLSLLVMVILICVSLFIQCYGYLIQTFEINNNGVLKSYNYINGLFNMGRNITIIVFLLINLVQCLGDCCEGNCSCKKETKQVETTEKAEETKEEAPAEEEAVEEEKEEKAEE